MKQEFSHLESKKLFTMLLRGETIVINRGKKDLEKTYESEKKALQEYNKKGWEYLKKGYVFNTDNLEVGKPYFHQFIGKENTGCLTLIHFNDKIGVYKHNDLDNASLMVFDISGCYHKTIEHIQGIPWDIKWSKSINALFIAANHKIVKLDLSVMEHSQLTQIPQLPTYFISLSNQYVFFGSGSLVSLNRLTTNEILFSKQVDIELYKGHSPQLCGTMSKNGTTLALCTHAGKIEILNHTGQIDQTIIGDFEMVENMAFLDDNRLLIHEKYGKGGLKIFNIKKGTEVLNPFKDTQKEGDIDGFDIDEDQNKFLTISRNKITVYHLKSLELLTTFSIAHCIKKGNARFFGQSTIAVRTDYGCFSLYHI